MAYLLDQLETLVSNISKPGVCLIKQGSSPNSTYAIELESWHQGIKKKLLNKSAKQISSKKLSNLIRFYQSSITSLIDELNIKKCPCSNQYQCHKKYLMPLISNLTESLVFINEQYKNFFDLESKLPSICEKHHCSIIRKRVNNLIKELSQTNINIRLLHLLLHPFTDFINNKSVYYTFNDKHFLYGWLEHLEKNWIFVFDTEEHSKEFCKQLIEWNLNSSETIDFFIEFITEKYQLEETKEEQLSTLRYFQKCFKQQVVINKTGYRPDNPTLKETLTNWVEQEIIYIENTCHISEKIMPSETTLVVQTERIKTNLSVPQLAAFLWVCVETGLYNKDQSKELLEHISKHFSTIGTDEISYDSLYNKFCSPKEIALEKIKDTILKQLKTIQRKLF